MEESKCGESNEGTRGKEETITLLKAVVSYRLLRGERLQFNPDFAF